MSDKELNVMKELLHRAIPAEHRCELPGDLWPAMLGRLEQNAFQVPWWDWALLGGIAVVLCIFPGLIPGLLYHL